VLVSGRFNQHVLRLGLEQVGVGVRDLTGGFLPLVELTLELINLFLENDPLLHLLRLEAVLEEAGHVARKSV